MSTVPVDALPATAVAATAPTHARIRVHSIDMLRGFVIVLMALDHVRTYFTAARFDPLDLTQTDPGLFMTRWITHLCAPVFIFLAGVSAYLVSRRCTSGELRRFLVTRGLWLIALEFTVVYFGWSFNLRYESGLILQVIWAIGASMIVLALIAHWRLRTIATVALALIAGHHLLDGVAPESFGQFAWVWKVLHVQGQTAYAYVLYPLIPWVGVMALGFASGRLFELDPQRRRRLLFAAGAFSLAAFVTLRALNVYGDPQPWSVQSSAVYTVLSFLDVHKYPPSLLYLLVTLGVGAALLGILETARGRFVEMLRTFGRAPLFFYVLHIFLAHFAAGVVALATGYGVQLLTNLFLFLPDGWGFGLTGVYVAWIAVLAALYPACRWFAELKQRRTDWWLSYV
jgi:uncharacterized membrane protein